jgi:hypothetical protein
MDPFFKISIAIIYELFPPINITCEKSGHTHSVVRSIPRSQRLHQSISEDERNDTKL